MVTGTERGLSCMGTSHISGVGFIVRYSMSTPPSFLDLVFGLSTPIPVGCDMAVIWAAPMGPYLGGGGMDAGLFRICLLRPLTLIPF